MVNQNADQTDNLNRVADHGRHHARRTAQRRGRFVDEFRLHLRTAVLEKERVAPVRDALEHERADFEHDALRNAHEEVGAQILRAAVQSRHPDQGDRREDSYDRILLIKAHVRELAQNEGDERGGAAPGGHGRRRSGDIPLVGRQVAEKAHQIGVGENGEAGHQT